MALTLSIENRANLPDGGPMDFTIQGKRGADIGRDLHLDWSLPDPARVVSSKHCEIRFREGAYWLTDVSTNGTFLNGQSYRMQAPHRLRDGDRLEVGHYILRVHLDEEVDEAPAPVSMPASTGDPWSGFASPAPPQAISSPPPPPNPNAMPSSDAMDWFADMPPPDLPPSLPRTDETWMRALMSGSAAQPKQAAPISAVQASVAPSQVQVAPPIVPPMDWGFGGTPASFPEVLPVSPPEPEKPVLQGPRPATLPPEMMQPVLASAATIAPASAQQPAPASRPVPSPELAVRSAAQPFERTPRNAGPVVSGDLSADQFLDLVARGADVPPEVFRQISQERIAEMIGAMLKVSVDDLRGLLQMRAQAKGMVRSTNQTTIQAFENNPLKFTPNTEEALRKMLAPGNRSYLSGVEAMQQSFADLRSHQMNTLSAMQQALKMVVDDLDPVTIERQTEVEGGLGGLMSNRKAKLWETFVTKWKAKTARHDNGFVDVFLIYFSEAYDAVSRKLK